MKVSIGRAARELGVSRETLRRWEAEGRLVVDRAPNGRRQYDLSKLVHLAPMAATGGRVTVAYARVASHETPERLQQQVALLESFCTLNGWQYQVITDVGSGLNFGNRGLRQLVARICMGEVGRLVVQSADRLMRLGSELVLSLCEQFGTEVVILNASEYGYSREELADDVHELVQLFSARLYQARDYAYGDAIERLRRIAEDLRRN